MKVRALVLDDSKVMRIMVINSLKKSGLADFSFIEARDGEDGLDKFDAKKIDVCFVDWNMPKMSGFDFIRQARELSGSKEIPMIMITSEKSMGKMIDALDNAGANAYICKPFTVDELHHKLAPIFAQLKK